MASSKKKTRTDDAEDEEMEDVEAPAKIDRAPSARRTEVRSAAMRRPLRRNRTSHHYRGWRSTGLRRSVRWCRTKTSSPPVRPLTHPWASLAHYVAVSRFIEEKRIPHFLFYGPPGTGKTTTILAIARKLYGPNFQSMILEVCSPRIGGLFRLTRRPAERVG